MLLQIWFLDASIVLVILMAFTNSHETNSTCQLIVLSSVQKYNHYTYIYESSNAEFVSLRKPSIVFIFPVKSWHSNCDTFESVVGMNCAHLILFFFFKSQNIENVNLTNVRDSLYFAWLLELPPLWNTLYATIGYIIALQSLKPTLIS